MSNIALLEEKELRVKRLAKPTEKTWASAWRKGRCQRD